MKKLDFSKVDKFRISDKNFEKTYGVSLKEFYGTCGQPEQNKLLKTQKVFVPKKVMDKIKVDAEHWKTLIETAGGEISKDKEKATIVIDFEAPVRSSSRNTR